MALNVQVTWSGLKEMGNPVLCWIPPGLSCQEVHATRADPKESLSSLPGVQCLTMMLAIYLAKKVAAILRAILTPPTKRLYEDRTAHLLCSNYWMWPIFQELPAFIVTLQCHKDR